MEYLVTGGAGFIGSNIVRSLVEKKKSVRVLDNLATGRIENIRDIMNSLDFIGCDIRDGETVRKAVKGVKYVIHLAALPSVPRSVKDPETSNDVNLTGTLNMLLAARDEGVERFVFSSSSSVYGDTAELPKRENMAPAPLSPYGAQKLAGEYYCNIFCRLYGLKTFSLRYFNVFGPRQNPKSQYAAVIPLFIESIRTGKPPIIHGDGKQTRDFTFVDDVVAANLRCCAAPAKAAGEVYNIAGGNRVSINRLAETLAKIMKKDVKPVHDDERSGDIRDSQGDPSKARKALGWKTKVQFEAGLKKTVEFFTNVTSEER
jgi:nucleoside-diphosphate-sugar epimerase